MTIGAIGLLQFFLEHPHLATKRNDRRKRLVTAAYRLRQYLVIVSQIMQQILRNLPARVKFRPTPVATWPEGIQIGFSSPGLPILRYRSKDP